MLAPSSVAPPQRAAYSVREVAELLSFDPVTVRKLIASGELAAVRIGRSYRVPASEIDRLTAVTSADVAA